MLLSEVGGLRTDFLNALLDSLDVIEFLHLVPDQLVDLLREGGGIHHVLGEQVLRPLLEVSDRDFLGLLRVLSAA